MKLARDVLGKAKVLVVDVGQGIAHVLGGTDGVPRWIFGGSSNLCAERVIRCQGASPSTIPSTGGSRTTNLVVLALDVRRQLLGARLDLLRRNVPVFFGRRKMRKMVVSGVFQGCVEGVL